MSNKEKLLKFLKEKNGRAYFYDIRTKFEWKTDYLSQLIKQLDNKVEIKTKNVTQSSSHGGKRYVKYLELVEEYKPERREIYIAECVTCGKTWKTRSLRVTKCRECLRKEFLDVKV